MNFEEAYSRLNDVVQRLEAGDLGLEESLALYEEGMALAAACNDWLDKAELRVRQLIPAPGTGLAGSGLEAVEFEVGEE